LYLLRPVRKHAHFISLLEAKGKKILNPPRSFFIKGNAIPAMVYKYIPRTKNRVYLRVTLYTGNLYHAGEGLGGGGVCFCLAEAKEVVIL
jgi:hypothetical protein